VNNQYDVLVCGAGIAGVAAALEAARAGLSVALIEKTILPGGLATSGLVNIYLPLCDGNGTQVIFGLAEELLHASTLYGPGVVPDGWGAPESQSKKGRYQVTFSPASFVLALDELLVASGVTTWLDTLACLPAMDGDRVAGVEIETKAGRETVQASITIDATGDADIACRAGAACLTSPNIMSIWALQATLKSAEVAMANGTGEPLMSLFARGGDSDDPEIESAERCWGIRSAQEITEFVLQGRAIMREHYRALQAGTGRANSYPLTLPTQAQYRMTRRIVGMSTLSTGQAWQRQDGSVGVAGDWRKPGSVWEIPYGALVPEKIRGLLVAGRCISSGGDAWHVTRVIPVAALTGQIAGVAACAAVAQSIDPAELDIKQLQRTLRGKGIVCEIDDIYDGANGPGNARTHPAR